MMDCGKTFNLNTVSDQLNLRNCVTNTILRFIKWLLNYIMNREDSMPHLIPSG